MGAGLNNKKSSSTWKAHAAVQLLSTKHMAYQVFLPNRIQLNCPCLYNTQHTEQDQRWKEMPDLTKDYTYPFTQASKRFSLFWIEANCLR